MGYLNDKVRMGCRPMVFDELCQYHYLVLV